MSILGCFSANERCSVCAKCHPSLMDVAHCFLVFLTLFVAVFTLHASNQPQATYPNKKTVIFIQTFGTTQKIIITLKPQKSKNINIYKNKTYKYKKEN